jgi:hypothetical protein
MNYRTELTNQDISGFYHLSAEPFYSPTLPGTVTTIPGTTTCFLMSHLLLLFFDEKYLPLI